jgi:hypothetical protein
MPFVTLALKAGFLTLDNLIYKKLNLLSENFYFTVVHLVRASRCQIGKVAGSCPALTTLKDQGARKAKFLNLAFSTPEYRLDRVKNIVGTN